MTTGAINEGQAPPKGWRLQCIGDKAFSYMTSGGTPSRSNTAFYEGSIPWVKSGELEDSELHDTEEHISEEAIANSAAKIFPKGTVLLAMYGATVGKTAILKVPAATNQAICAIQPRHESFLPKFLQYQLMQIRPHLLRQRHGGAQPNISQTIIRDVELPIPPLPEQKKIATVLSKHRRAVEAQTAIIENLRELKKSMMNRLFTHGLRGEASSWSISTVGVQCAVLNGYAFSSEDYADDGIINFRVVNIRDEGRVNLENDVKYLPFSFAELHRDYLLNDGDVLLVMVGATRGKLCRLKNEHLPALMNQNMWRIVPLKANLDKKYLYYYLCFKIPEFMRQFTDEARGFFKKGDLRKVSIPLPSLADQILIANALLLIDDKISIHEAKQSALEDLFKAMLNKLMAGVIRVKDLEIDTSEVEVA